jgi:hypothetical protein
VYCKPEPQDGQKALHYLGRYAHRVIITNRGIASIRQAGSVSATKTHVPKHGKPPATPVTVWSRFRRISSSEGEKNSRIATHSLPIGAKSINIPFKLPMSCH